MDRQSIPSLSSKLFRVKIFKFSKFRVLYFTAKSSNFNQICSHIMDMMTLTAARFTLIDLFFIHSILIFFIRSILIFDRAAQPG